MLLMLLITCAGKDAGTITKKGTMTGNGQMQEQWRDRGQMQKYDGKVIST
jgi:hypothetical protein